VRFPEPFHGPHISPSAAEDLAVEWGESITRCTQIRVKAHTCECRETLYELCQAAGLRFIRRTVRNTRPAVVSETIWMSPTEADRLWARLLDGRTG
jgi:hypothetical protein